MSMSTRVVGFRPPDEKWNQMKAAWLACKAVGVEPPRDVARFFGDEEPSEAGVEVNIKAAVREYSADMTTGLEVDIRNLPKDVHLIRFENSW